MNREAIELEYNLQRHRSSPIYRRLFMKTIKEDEIYIFYIRDNTKLTRLTFTGDVDELTGRMILTFLKELK